MPREEDGYTQLAGLATGVPTFRVEQAQLQHFMARVLHATTKAEVAPSLHRYLEALYAKSGIQTRYSVIEDYTHLDPGRFTFFPSTWTLEPFPTTAERMGKFAETAVDLAEQLAWAALDDAAMSPQEVTHLILCTCTGFFTPGPDIQLIHRLGIPATASRYQIGFMGCYAGFSGMHMADTIVRANSDAVVLQVCVELCSLHFQKGTSQSTLIANCLFADGGAASVFTSSERSPLGGRAAIIATASKLDDQSSDQIGWQIGDHGFIMGLDPYVPTTLAALLPHFVNSLVARTPGEAPIDRWAFHPGGPRILERCQQVLELDDGAMMSAHSVLNDFGNISSPSIFFVLERELEYASSGELLTALGFGPGITIEGALLRL